LIGLADARARGISDGDIVRVFNDRGACLAAAKLTDHMVEGVAIIATGAWFDPVKWSSENPLEKHGNPNAVTIDIGASRLSQATVAQSCLVEIEVFTGAPPEVTAFDLPEFVASDPAPRETSM
jgi:biotin/methionine sulfoxide reductase